MSPAWIVQARASGSPAVKKERSPTRVVAGADDLARGRLADAQALQELRALLGLQLGDFLLRLGADHHGVRRRAVCAATFVASLDSASSATLRTLSTGFVVSNCRLRRTALSSAERGIADARQPLFEALLEPLERRQLFPVALLRGPASEDLLLELDDPALDDVEVRDDQLGLQFGDVALRVERAVRVRRRARGIEVPHHVDDAVALPRRGEDVGHALALHVQRDAGHVHKIHVSVRDLLGRDGLRDRVEPVIGHRDGGRVRGRLVRRPPRRACR